MGEHGTQEDEKGDQEKNTHPEGDLDQIIEPTKEKMLLMAEEERNLGAVPLSTYIGYLKHAGGAYWALTILLLLLL